MPRRRKRIQTVEFLDFGTPERLARGLKTGAIVVEGEGRQRNARIVTVIESMPREAIAASQWLMATFLAASFSGCRCSNFQPRVGAAVFGDLTPTESAERARRVLWRLQQAIGHDAFMVLWESLHMLSCQRETAIRLGCRRQDVKGRLLSALEAAADWRRRY